MYVRDPYATGEFLGLAVQLLASQERLSSVELFAYAM
jgi:hypothetical protein